MGQDAGVPEIKEAVVANMQDWGRRYPYAGYGGRFSHWLTETSPKPYGSYGNGSAMRVSAAGWLYPTIERTREVAQATAEVTHNHTEGIKGRLPQQAAFYGKKRSLKGRNQTSLSSCGELSADSPGGNHSFSGGRRF